MSKRFVTTGEAAEMLGITGKTARAMAENGALRGYRLPSGRMRIIRADVERYMREHAFGPEQLQTA